MRRLAVLTVAALCLSQASVSEEVTSVTIDNFAFTPQVLTIAAGTSVQWTNRDDIPHTITGADGTTLVKSDALDTDDQFLYRFDHAGRFAYFCSLHAHMQGVVVVQ